MLLPCMLTLYCRLTKPYAVMTLCHVISSIIAAPLAAGLLSLHGRGGLSGWQWLFIIEGVPSVLMGAAMMVWLPSSPLTAHSWLSRAEAELLHLKVWSAETAGCISVLSRTHATDD